MNGSAGTNQSNLATAASAYSSAQASANATYQSAINSAGSTYTGSLASSGNPTTYTMPQLTWPAAPASDAIARELYTEQTCSVNAL